MTWLDTNVIPIDGPEKDDPRYTFDDQRGKQWYKDGKLHRDDNLCANVDTSGRVKQWFKNGLLHRDYDLPAEVWPPERPYDIPSYHRNGYYILDLNHRLSDRAQVEVEGVNEKAVQHIRYLKSTPSAISGLRAGEEETALEGHALYGVALTRKEFELIKNYAADEKIPLYAAWLIEMERTTKQDVKELKAADGFDFPFAWVCRVLGVTDEKLLKIFLPRGAPRYRSAHQTYAKAVANVIEYDKTHGGEL